MATHRVVLGVLAVMLLAGASAVWSRQMPRGSFLAQPAYSVAQLAVQIRTNPTVAGRYTKHFGVPASPLARYAQTQLGLRPLPHRGKYRVFFIKPDGSIGSRVRYLPKGTQVFLHLRSGQPVLLGKCGNPLTARLPGYTPPRVTAIPPRVTKLPARPSQEPPMEPPVPTMPIETPGAPVPPLEPIALSPWQADPVLLSPTIPEVYITPASSRKCPPLTLLLLAGLPGLVESVGKPTNPPPIIPEPASVALLAAAIALLTAYEQRRRSKAGRAPR